MSTISFSGLASGIDSEQIIKTLRDSRELTVNPFEREKEFQEKESSALEEFNTKLLSLNALIKEFQTLQGSGIGKSASSSQPDFLKAQATSQALTGSYTIDVQSLARSATFSFNDRFTSRTDALPVSGSGTIQVQVGTGDSLKTISLDVDSSTTLQSLNDQINQKADGVLSASIVNFGTEAAPSFGLVIKGLESGVDKGTLQVVSDPAIGIFQSSQLDQATNAQFTVSGLGTITRSSNQVDGIIQGVTLDLKAAGIGPVEISISDDREKTADRFEKVIGELNALIKFSKEKSTVSREENERGQVTNVYQDLAKSRVDENILTQVKDALRGSLSPVEGSTVRNFADLGVTTNRDGTLAFDRKKFVQGITDQPSSAESLLHSFADSVSMTGGVIDLATRFQGTIAQAKSANDQVIRNIQDKLDRFETNLQKQEETMKLMFANLETRISKLNSVSNSLSSILASSSSGR